jgi:hypothetical protein
MPYVPALINRIDGVLAKDEGASYGVDAAPVAASNGIRISDRIWQRARFYNLFDNQRDDEANGGYVPLLQGAAAGFVGELDIGWAARGRGSAYTAGGAANAIEPGAHDLHAACGWPGTFSVNLYNYAPITSGARPSATVYVYAAGQLWKLAGCRGRLRYLWRPGRLTIVRFQIRGLLVGVGTDVALPVITYNTQSPPPATSTAPAIGTFVPDFTEMELDGGNTVDFIESGAAADGVQSADYGMIKPTWRVKTKTQSIANYSPLADQRAPTTRALAISQGTAANNKLSVADTIQPLRQSNEEQTQFAGYEISYRGSVPVITYGP